MSAADQAQVVLEMDGRLEAAINAGSDDATRQGLALEAAMERRNLVAFSDEDRFALLEPQVPLVLLPVRLETAFMGNTNGLERLRVRVYPDTIHLDGFDPRISANELELGNAYHARLEQKPAQRAALDAWLARVLGPGRASWVRVHARRGVTSEPVEELDERPTRVWTLPDQWRLRLVWGDQSMKLSFPHAVRRPLVVGPSAEDRETLGEATLLDRLWNGNTGGVASGEGMLWMLDFEQAQLAGMAIDIDLTDNNQPALRALQTHLINDGVIDEITVSGVQSALNNAASAEALSRLFTAHSIDRDLSILAQGSATNNDARRPTPTASADRASGANADRLRKALGLAAGAAPAFADTELDEDQAAGAMARCLWRATLGDFLERQIGMEDNEMLEELRQFFCRSVRARGPLSTLQVDREPYGILPIIPSTQYRPLNPDRLADNVRKLVDDQIDKLLPTARARVSSRPAPESAGEERRRAFLTTLAQEAHPGLVAGWLLGNRASFSNEVPSELFESSPAFASFPAELEGTPLAKTVLFDGHPIPVTPGVPFVRYRESLPKNARTPWTEQDLLPGEDGLSFDDLLVRPGRKRYPVRLYRECPKVLNGTLAQILTGDPPKSPADPLLFTFLRHGLLLTFEKIARALLDNAGIREHRPFVDDETESMRTFPLIDQLIDEVLGGDDASALRLPLPDALAANLPAMLRVEVEELVESLAFIGEIGRENSNALELLFREHLGLISYRLDAWHTAFATQRLEELRERASGSHIGGYGRVQMLRVGDETAIGEFIPAPSLGHATTAAVLRSGFTNRAAEMKSARANAVNLSSSRVRGARDVLDGIRQGRTLATVLGHRFERLLREEELTSQDFTNIIRKARKAHPGVSGKARNHQTDVGADVVAGSELVDGLAMLRKYEEDGFGPSGEGAGAEFDAEQSVLDRLADEIDAVVDLTLAESVHQIVNGRPERAGASLDVIGRGDSPPERFDVVETPRSGTALTVRVLVLEMPPALPQVPSQPERNDIRRAARVAAGTLAALLDRWLGLLSEYGAWLNLDVRSPTGNISRREWISLDALDIDWVTLYLGMPAGGATSDGLLHRRIESAAEGWAELAEVEHTLSIDDQSSGPNGEPALEITQALLASVQRTLSEARPLEVRELLDQAGRDGEAPPAGERPTEEITELSERTALAGWLFGHAVAALRAAAGELPAAGADGVVPARMPPPDLGSLPRPDGRSAPSSSPSLLDLEDVEAVIAGWSISETDGSAFESLRMSMRDLASIGLAEAEPSASATTETLLRQAHAVSKSIADRIRRAADAADAKTRLQALFGRHLNVMPVHEAALGASLRDALSQSDTLLGGEPEIATRWAHEAGSVRQRLHELLQTLQLAETVREKTLVRFQVGQNPTANAGRWAAIEGSAGMPTRLAIAALEGAQETLAGEHFSGFVIDEWVETIPSAVETAALALQASSPTSRAPQCILLAMTGHPDERWTPGALDLTLDWAFDLAAIRGLRPEDLGALKDLVPAMVFGQYR